MEQENNLEEIHPEEIERNQEPPAKEPARQYYFMEKCQRAVKKEEQRLGRRMTFHTETFGCQMNARDSEKLAGILEAAGLEASDSEQADFVIYNTCTVRENANNRVYGRLGYLHSLKKKNPAMRIALCGCMMQEPGIVEKLKKSYRFVNLIFGTHNLYRFAELLARSLETDGMVVEVWEGTDQIVEDLPAQRKYPFKSGVNIMFGCNNFCSYCIVPYVRGREKSREPQDILQEIKRLAMDGVVEVMLLGQNVNSYGKTLAHPMTFAQLLQEVEKIDGIRRIRFMTSHPKDLSDELIDVMRASKKICRHLHLPLQSGSSRILKAMNRRYSQTQYLELVEKIRGSMPDLALTTDLIVGFPGETEEDFQETLRVVKTVGFDSAYTFIYSRRTGTPAASMEGQVEASVVKDRFDRLLKTVQEISTAKAGRLTGSIQTVLVESVNDQDPALVTGKLDNHATVHLPGAKELVGRLVQVRLEECRGFYYYGTIADDALQT